MDGICLWLRPLFEPSITAPNGPQTLLQLRSNQSNLMASKITFPRSQAGEYNVLENGKYVGLIQKLNSAKWCVYFCSNPATKGKPQHVAKTLKDCKAFCERHFESNDVVTENSPELDNLLNSVRKSPNPDVKEMMREMLNKNHVIDLTADDIDIDSIDLSDVIDLGDDVPFSHFLTEEEAMAL